MPSENDLLRSSLEELRALGKEVAAHVREASADTKRGWEKLQPKLEKVEAMFAEHAEEAGTDVEQRASSTVEDIKRRLLELKAKL
jgi:hypothetical protein